MPKLIIFQLPLLLLKVADNSDPKPIFEALREGSVRAGDVLVSLERGYQSPVYEVSDDAKGRARVQTFNGSIMTRRLLCGLIGDGKYWALLRGCADEKRLPLLANAERTFYAMDRVRFHMDDMEDRPLSWPNANQFLPRLRAEYPIRQQQHQAALDALQSYDALYGESPNQKESTMQKQHTKGILPSHTQLLELINAHGLPAFMEGVQDALAAIASDADCATQAGAGSAMAQNWAHEISETIRDSLCEDYPHEEGA